MNMYQRVVDVLGHIVGDTTSGNTVELFGGRDSSPPPEPDQMISWWTPTMKHGQTEETPRCTNHVQFSGVFHGWVLQFNTPSNAPKSNQHMFLLPVVSRSDWQSLGETRLFFTRCQQTKQAKTRQLYPFPGRFSGSTGRNHEISVLMEHCLEP